MGFTFHWPKRKKAAISPAAQVEKELPKSDELIIALKEAVQAYMQLDLPNCAYAFKIERDPLGAHNLSLLVTNPEYQLPIATHDTHLRFEYHEDGYSWFHGSTTEMKTTLELQQPTLQFNLSGGK